MTSARTPSCSTAPSPRTSGPIGSTPTTRRSAVNTEIELLSQRSLDRLAADRTTFAIAHRLSTVKDADRIVVPEGGEVVERGTHDELLEADGLYANLWRVQAGDLDSLPETFVERAAKRRSEVSVGDVDDG